jgi:HK97 family phage prohead protease
MTTNSSIRMVRSTPEVRTESDGRKTLRGHFAVFDQWTEIDSWQEGHFRERVRPGAMKRTFDHAWHAFREVGRNPIKVNYNHGFDPQIADKQLGPIKELREDDTGAYYEVRLLDTDYNRDYIVPAAEDNLLGASFRFTVPKGGDLWDREPDLHERDLNELNVHEFGPVDWPAYEAASAGIRAAADFLIWKQLDEDGREEFAALIRKAHNLGTSDPEPAPEPDPDDPADGHSFEAARKLIAAHRKLTKDYLNV